MILEGISGSDRPVISPDLITLKHLSVEGVFGASGVAWRWVVELFAAGLLPLSELVSHRFPLDGFETAFAALHDPESGALKVELLPGAAP